MSKKIIIDGQLFQTAAWHRGMGKYSLELLIALSGLVSKSKEIKLELILTNKIEDNEHLRQTLRQRIPSIDLVYLDLKRDEIGNKNIADANRATIDRHIASQQRLGYDVDFLILSVMQGVIYPVFPSLPEVNKLVIFYDLIPLMFQDVYLRNSITRSEYLPRIGELLRADKYLAISKTVANDLAIFLGIDSERIVSIDGGAINHSNESKVISVPDQFVLMPTGNDLRKNNRRAVLGFENFNKRHNEAYTLVITSYFKEHEIAELAQLSDHLLFTGNISGGELRYLYEHACALLFPPEYEGLGMPILEAVQHNKPIACSNIAVFREMSTRAFTYFDPYSIVDISGALDKAVSAEYEVDEVEYKELLARYTWDHSASKLLAATKNSPKVTKASPRLRLAVFGPGPGCPHEVGRLIQENYAELSRVYDVDYIYGATPAGQEWRINYLPYITTARKNTVGLHFNPVEYAASVYHIGNDASFARTLFMALGSPGIVVLYDTDLSLAWEGMVTEGLVSLSRTLLEKAIEKRYRYVNAKNLASLLFSQHAIVVFSEKMARIVRQVLKRVGSQERVVVMNRPVSSLIYEDAVAEKVIPSRIVAADDANTPMSGAPYVDYERMVEISKTQVAIFQAGSSVQSVFEALRFGARPFIPKNMANDEIPSHLVTLYDDIETTPAVADEWLQQLKANKKQVSEGISYIRNEHQQKRFIAALEVLLK